jgi:hypothetical protein
MTTKYMTTNTEIHDHKIHDHKHRNALGGDVYTRKLVPVANQESERSCISVFVVMYFVVNKKWHYKTGDLFKEVQFM